MKIKIPKWLYLNSEISNPKSEIITMFDTSFDANTNEQIWGLFKNKIISQ